MILDPILARQVETNAQDVENLREVIAQLSSVDMDTSKDVNAMPNSYTSIVSYEVKSCSAVGLDAVHNFKDIEYAYVHTYTSNSESVAMKAYQQAYAIDAKDAIVTSYRVAAEDGESWSKWKSGLAQNAGGAGGGTTESPTEPGEGEQEPGDFWFEPIEAVNLPASQPAASDPDADALADTETTETTEETTE